MPTDSECRKALTAIRELYVEIHDLDLDAYLLGKLFEVKVITRRQHDNIRARGGVDEFWDIIESSLRVGDKTKFVRLLEVMSTNDDTTVKDLAKKLSEAAEISISIPDPYPIDEQPVTGVEKSVDRGKGGGSFSMFQLLECMDCVCRIENCGGSDGGTGFVGNIKEEHFIITCHHIIPNETAAKEGLFMFNHNDDQYVPGKIRGEDLFDMTSSKWFWTDENLNYTAIKVDKVQLSNIRYTRKDGNEQTKMEISGIPLNLAKVDMPFDMEHIFTIIQQTPTMKLCEGSCKQRKDINSAMIQYRMNTFKGSGGSPIFKERNGELCLTAMHIGNQGSKKFNFGVRISEVLKDIKGKDHSPMPVDVREFTLE